MLQGNREKRLATLSYYFMLITVQWQLGGYFFMYLMTSASATSKITSITVSVIHITPNLVGVLTALTSL